MHLNETQFKKLTITVDCTIYQKVIILRYIEKYIYSKLQDNDMPKISVSTIKFILKRIKIEQILHEIHTN